MDWVCILVSHTFACIQCTKLNWVEDGESSSWWALVGESGFVMLRYFVPYLFLTRLSFSCLSLHYNDNLWIVIMHIVGMVMCIQILCSYLWPDDIQLFVIQLGCLWSILILVMCVHGHFIHLESIMQYFCGSWYDV